MQLCTRKSERSDLSGEPARRCTRLTGLLLPTQGVNDRDEQPDDLGYEVDDPRPFVGGVALMMTALRHCVLHSAGPRDWISIREAGGPGSKLLSRNLGDDNHSVRTFKPPNVLRAACTCAGRTRKWACGQYRAQAVDNCGPHLCTTELDMRNALWTTS
jgi:hypothetical protein